MQEGDRCFYFDEGTRERENPTEEASAELSLDKAMLQETVRGN